MLVSFPCLATAMVLLQPAAGAGPLVDLREASAGRQAPARTAQRSTTGSVLRLGIWGLGYNLALAAITNTKGTDAAAQLSEKLFAKAKELGEALEVPIPALPAGKTKKPAERQGDAMQYLLSGAGKEISRQLLRKHGADHAALFDLAVRCQLLTLLYLPGDDFTQTLKAAIEKFGLQSGLPDELWRPLAAKIEAGITFSDMVSETQATSRRIAEHLGASPATRAPPAGDADGLAHEVRRLNAEIATLEHELRTQSIILSEQVLAARRSGIDRKRRDRDAAVDKLKILCTTRPASACDALTEKR